MSAKRVISIIDDDESIRTALVGLMRSLGYAARGFASAEEFLDSGVVQSVACIITDIQMPGMSGIALRQHLMAGQCSPPVIMITARHEKGLEERALASGAAFFLRKPFDMEALVGCLEKVLKVWFAHPATVLRRHDRGPHRIRLPPVTSAICPT